jgi:hypothetical protein
MQKYGEIWCTDNLISAGIANHYNSGRLEHPKNSYLKILKGQDRENNVQVKIKILF